jgi:uncharacterized alpha/beta hydrolase family protein
MIDHCSVKYLAILFCCSTLPLFAGCGLWDIRDQANLISNRGVIHGKVEIRSTQSAPAYVQLYRQKEQHIEIVNKTPLAKHGRFFFDVLPDTYMVGVFIDANGDTEYQAGEHATYLGMENINPKLIEVTITQRIDIGTLVIKGPIGVSPGIEERNALGKGLKNIGQIIALNDPMFDRKNASIGFWRPFDFAEQYGGGLMMLQAFEKGKTPVIFIHGIFGSSLDFEQIIASLDRDKFQPWVLYYPSGISLDLISNYLVKALHQLHIRYSFPRVNIIAHSLGGLMTRSFVMKHLQNQSRYKISLVVTINSPMYGMDSATMGVKTSPIVVPVWRDVASDSDYIKKVHAWRWPKEIPYHLIFSFLPDEDGDGVVPLKSQLSLSLQDEAERIHGFQAQHAAILKEKELIQRLNGILSVY